jgi:ligand-binding sensor domain-containing protein
MCFFGSWAMPAAGSICAAVGILGRMAAVAWAMQLCAGAQDFQVRNWQIENGLPDSSVTALAQTPDGYLWVGTRKGLVRFDGDSFKRVLTANGSTVKDSRILGLLTDRQGNLWIASQSGLITEFSDGEFHTRYPTEDVTEREGAPGAQPLNAKTWQNFNLIFALDGTGRRFLVGGRGHFLRGLAA